MPSLTKMPGRQTKFSVASLQNMDNNEQKISEWCWKGKDDYSGYCSFVTLTLNVAMQEKHNHYNMLLKINIRKQLNITRITSKQTLLSC